MKFLREKRLQKCVSVVLSAVMLSTVFVGSFASSQSYGESVTIEENVLENDLSKESVLKTVTSENVWSTSDFTFSGTTLTGLSEAGVVKLETNKDLVIPNVNADGNAIETIGVQAFYSKGINSVKLPDSVKTISMAAFSKNNITSLYIPSSVKKIDRMAFLSNSISNLEIANDVENLEIIGYAFMGNSLKSVKLPYGVTTVGSNAFKSNTGTDENPGEVCLNTVNENHIDNLNIYVKDGMQVLKFVGWSASDFTYDSTIVTGFSDSGNEKLTNDKHLVLPLLNDMGQKITSVGRTAFANCGLKSVIIPTGVSKFVVDASAFSSNEISRVVLPEGVINLEATSFESNKLESVKFPSTVFKIGNASFRNNNISNIEISPKVFRLQMDGNAFASNNVKSVDLPISIEKLTKSAFYENPGVDEMPGVVYMYTTNPKNFDNSRLHYMDSPIENNKSQYQNLILKQVTNKEVLFAQKLSNKEVGYNVDKENLELPSSIDLYLNNGDVETVAVSWSSDDYDKTVVGHYNFKADYVLPDGVLGEKPEVNLVVEVVLPDEIPEDMRVWNNNDFVFDNTSIVGLSADGVEKAKVNKNLVIPDKNAADEFITEIKAGAFNADNIFGDVEFEKEEVISVNGFKTIKLPSSVKYINPSAFNKNTGMKPFNNSGGVVYLYSELLGIKIPSIYRFIPIDFNLCVTLGATTKIGSYDQYC